MKEDVVDGKISSNRGSLNYLGTNFRLRNGVLSIIKDVVYLELLGETKITDMNGNTHNINLIIDREKIENIKPRLVSLNDPKLKTEDIISILFGVKKYEDKKLYDPAMLKEKDLNTSIYLRQQFIKLIDSNFATPLARNILQKTGLVDEVSVSYSPQEQTTQSDISNTTLLSYLKDTKYSFTKYLTDDVLMGYSITLGEKKQRLQLRHELEISYRLKGNIFLRGIYNFGVKDSISTSRYSGETKIGIEPVWRFGGEKWEE